MAELSVSYARLAANQTRPGYCIVILRRHACELHELGPDELSDFWTDVAQVAAAVDAVFRPVKLDYLVMGHRCPHLHCHVYPQHEDSHPHRPVDISEGHRRLTEDERRRRVADLRAVLVGRPTPGDPAGAAPA